MPPGTGMPQELTAIFKAINIAVTAIIFTGNAPPDLFFIAFFLFFLN